MFKEKLKIFLEEIYWVAKYRLYMFWNDTKKFVLNINSYIMFVTFLMFYFLIHNDKTFIYLWIVVIILLLFDDYKLNHWRSHMRKSKRKEYFSSPHPEKKLKMGSDKKD